MITAYLQGGVGNQMFTYAAALAAARRHGVPLELNASSFGHDPMRQYSLGLWAGVSEPVRTDPPSGQIVRERQLPYEESLAVSMGADCTLWGYFQTEKWFGAVREELARRFVPRQPITHRGLDTQRRIRDAGNRSVFLTIRRTDYTKSDYHGVLPIDYYRRALDLVATTVVDPDVFVFSDEPEWCEANLRLPCKATVVGNYDRTTKSHLGREDEELWLMAQCRHAIMANSSYSWWGAWNGPDRSGGMIVAPTRWFLRAGEDPRDIVPERWTRL